MPSPLRYLAISGSLRTASTNTELLRAFARHTPPSCSVDVYDRLGELPLFNPDLEGETPDSVLHLAREVEASDGILIASPEYAHGIPGALKNALDWLVSRFEIPGKPVMLVHASTRGLFVREHLGEVLKTMACRLYPGRTFEMHLISKRREEIALLLDTPEMRSDIRSALEDFSSFVASPA